MIRADQVVGVHARQTPAITGKPSHWLLNAVLPLSTGSGQPDAWATSPLHRTLIQIGHEPRDAPEHLARLLAQLDAVNAAGIITATASERELPASAAAHPTTPRPAPPTTSTSTVRFQFTPFRGTEPGHHYDPDYL